MKLRLLLVTDADNTLWETDGVYAAAQLDLLRRVEEGYGITVRADDRLQFVREFDQALAVRHPRGLRYPTSLLVQTLVSADAGNPERAIADALERGRFDPRAESIANAFIERVSNDVPQLRAGVAAAMLQLAESTIRIIVLTEGDLSRCTRLLELHGLNRYVFTVVSEDKTVETYLSLRNGCGRSDRAVMVGDQIDRDIELSKLAGYTTVYFPGGFNPQWTRGRQITADHIIASFEQILEIMGVSVTSGSSR